MYVEKISICKFVDYNFNLLSIAHKMSKFVIVHLALYNFN